MKKYIAYSRAAGAFESALLVFANSAKEAKKIFWNDYDADLVCSEYIDIGVKLLRNKPWLDKEAVKDTPHCISPKYCKCCGIWGQSEIGKDDLCDSCRGGKE
jgi:hypothetical protein